MKFKAGDRVMLIVPPGGLLANDNPADLGKVGTVSDEPGGFVQFGMSIVHAMKIYVVDFPERLWCVREDCLRKIDDDDDSRKVLEWDVCVWQPERSVA